MKTLWARYYSALYHSALHCSTLHCTVLYCTALYYTALPHLSCPALLYCTVRTGDIDRPPGHLQVRLFQPERTPYRPRLRYLRSLHRFLIPFHFMFYYYFCFILCFLFLHFISLDITFYHLSAFFTCRTSFRWLLFTSFTYFTSLYRWECAWRQPSVPPSVWRPRGDRILLAR